MLRTSSHRPNHTLTQTSSLLDPIGVHSHVKSTPLDELPHAAWQRKKKNIPIVGDSNQLLFWAMQAQFITFLGLPITVLHAGSFLLQHSPVRDDFGLV